MNRCKAINRIRLKLKKNIPSIGSWIQIPNSSVAEILGQAGYDWVAVDLEHGSIGIQTLPDIFRALELGTTLPLARVAHGDPKDCKQALDAGAGGIIVPMVESAEQLEEIHHFCKWPPAGTRGVGYSRANLFGKNFKEYTREAQTPLLIAQIEHVRAIEQLTKMLQVTGLDALFIGPYDLSASMGITAQFEDPEFTKIMRYILATSKKLHVACGVHVVLPDQEELKKRIHEGYRFIAYSIDGVFLYRAVIAPTI